MSLAYVDNGYNTDINNWNVDMWENGPIRRPYVNQRCIMTYTRCDPDTAEAVNKPAVVDDLGFSVSLAHPRDGARQAQHKLL